MSDSRILYPILQVQAEQGPGADCLQRPLRSRFRQRLRPGVRPTLHQSGKEGSCGR
jgi:hypothetical protein